MTKISPYKNSQTVISLDMLNKKNGITPMEKLTQGYEKFIKNRETNNKGKELFDKAIKKSSKPKGRVSK